MIGEKVVLRVRMSASDAHYAGELVNGSKILDYFGDVATELSIRHDGDESLFRAYDSVEFLAPVYAGDFIEYHGWIESVGKTSRKMKFEAYKVIELARDPNLEISAANVLKEPLLVGRASGTLIVPADRQRGPQDPKFKE
ncbi:MAG: 3-aminobutyryl-CoA ammonia lyase [Thermoanaerobacterales bacterium]|jgi:3-aminobutyryl-CoA ammonia-lyase|nr:3-aminobutyryl-CoA ammonia lyase [Thermoanaerobacterales bacterium]